MPWADDGAVPVAHHDIVSILEAVGAGAVTDALLALFELFEQAEVSWNCSGCVLVVPCIACRLSLRTLGHRCRQQQGASEW